MVPAAVAAVAATAAAGVGGGARRCKSRASFVAGLLLLVR